MRVEWPKLLQFNSAKRECVFFRHSFSLFQPGTAGEQLHAATISPGAISIAGQKSVTNPTVGEWLPWIWHFPMYWEYLGIIIPIDELIFFRGVALAHQPESVTIKSMEWMDSIGLISMERTSWFSRMQARLLGVFTWPISTCFHLFPLVSTCFHLFPLVSTCFHLFPLVSTCFISRELTRGMD